MGTTAQNSDRSSLTITLLVPTAPHPIVQTPLVEPGREALKERAKPACLSASDFISGIDDHLETVRNLYRNHFNYFISPLHFSIFFSHFLLSLRW